MSYVSTMLFSLELLRADEHLIREAALAAASSSQSQATWRTSDFLGHLADDPTSYIQAGSSGFMLVWAGLYNGFTPQTDPVEFPWTEAGGLAQLLLALLDVDLVAEDDRALLLVQPEDADLCMAGEFRFVRRTPDRQPHVQVVHLPFAGSWKADAITPPTINSAANRTYERPAHR
jgi:hypothetical protein